MHDAETLKQIIYVEPLPDGMNILDEKRQKLFKIFKRTVWICIDPEGCFSESLKNILVSIRDNSEFWDNLPEVEKLPYLIGALKNQGRKILNRCVDCQKNCPIEDLLNSFVDNEIPSPYDVVEQKEYINIIKQKLEPKDFELLYLSEGEELSSKEVGEVMKLKDTNVRQKVRRIKRKLQKSLKAMGL